MSRRLALILAANCVAATGVLLGINEWTHPGTMNNWIGAAALSTFWCGGLIGYAIGRVHGDRR